MLLAANGRPYDEPEGTGLSLPDVRREPPAWQTGQFKTVDECAEAALAAFAGWFQYPSWLIEQTLRSPRARGPVQTRLNGLTGTALQWVPGRDNDIGRRAVKAIEEDWPLIASAAARYQLSQWGLLLGVGFAQKHWYRSPASRRLIPRLEPWHPQWCVWDWSLNNRRGAYRIWTIEGWEVVPSPALQVPGEPFFTTAGYNQSDPRRWVVHEPFGTQSFRQGLIHAVWASALGWQFADDDMSALCERQGLGGFKLKYPKTTEGKGSDGKINPQSSLGQLMRALTTLGRKFVLPVEVYPEGNMQGLASYDVVPFEWSGVGFDIVKGTKESKAQDLAVLILGHNTTVSSTTAGASAGANVGNLIRGDLRLGDVLNEIMTVRQQVLADWAAANFGDPSYAPVAVPINDAPMANEPAARTILSLSQGLDNLRALGVPDETLVRLMSWFQIDVQELGPAQPTTKTAPLPSKSAYTDAEREALKADILGEVQALLSLQEPA